MSTVALHVKEYVSHSTLTHVKRRLPLETVTKVYATDVAHSAHSSVKYNLYTTRRGKWGIQWDKIAPAVHISHSV